MNEAGRPLLITLVGRAGSGRRAVVEAAVGGRGLGLIALDARALLSVDEPARLLGSAFRDAALHGAALLIAHADALLDDTERGPGIRRALEQTVDELGWLVFLLLEKRATPPRWFMRHRLLTVHLPESTVTQRQRQWSRLLRERLGMAPADVTPLADALAAKFRLTAGGIAEACERAATTAGDAAGDDAAAVRWATVHGCAASVSAPHLGGLAERLDPGYGWDDLVLPEPVLDLLRDVGRRVRHRRRVMEEWGFEATLSRGRGVNALFSGPPGTGKTMAAEVLATELQMELFRIDLSAVVSKYIGETEKNLSRIFREAEHADVILFFDEADALFGKRSEVRDAHDRYANIEINYLMQQMESYAGLAVLATNLRKNMDDAFLRRIAVAVEFPMPGAEDRLRIWAKALPGTAPVAGDVDLEFLARTFELSGGNIRNIGLAAAYLAAEQEAPITMAHLIRATQRELAKIGKRAIREDFGPYYFLLERAGARSALR